LIVQSAVKFFITTAIAETGYRSSISAFRHIICMSAIQSHTITEAEENSFNFPSQPRLTQMNVRPDMLRQQGLPSSQMLSLNTPQFLPTQQQQGGQHIGLLPASSNPNPQMSMMGRPPANSPTMQQQYQMQLQQQHTDNQRRLRLQHQTQGLSQSGAAPGPHIGLGPPQIFPGMMQQVGSNVPVRRVASQPQSLNQSPNHLTGSVAGMNPTLNTQASMGHLRQVSQQHANARIQQQQMQGQISSEMAMALSRQGNLMQQGVSRTPAQTQILGSLSQPPALTQAHPGGIPSSHLQNAPQNAMSHPHPQPQLSASPRPGSHPSTSSSMPAPTQGSSQGTPNRVQLSDDPMFMNFPNTSFQSAQHNPRSQGNNNQFPFMPSSTPPIHHGDASQSIAPSLANPQGLINRGSFQVTPAQQLEQMQHTTENYGTHFKMHPSQSSIPQRQSPHSTHITPGPLPPPPPPIHPSPHQQDPMSHIAPQRPQSQPTAQPRRPPSQTEQPHASQSQLPANTLPPGRTPSLPQSQHGLSQPLNQPQLSASAHPPPMAHRSSLPNTSGSTTTVPSSALPLPEGGAIPPQRVRDL
jgi:hypothetical protein